MARPMIMRWISEVPSKIVNIVPEAIFQVRLRRTQSANEMSV